MKHINLNVTPYSVVKCRSSERGEKVSLNFTEDILSIPELNIHYKCIYIIDSGQKDKD